MTVKLFDYQAKEVEFDVGDINDIGAMSIQVLSGDEVLTVIYKDFTSRSFDSCSTGRYVGYNDGCYEVYNANTGVNLFNSKAFTNRNDSYWFYRMDEEDEP